MQIDIQIEQGQKIAVVDSQDVLISDVDTALDLLMSVRYDTGCDRIAIAKEAICEDFFQLRTGLAGEVLQKVVNYQLHFACYGDFSCYTSKALRDFIYESNHGRDVFFAATAAEAVTMLASI